MSADWVGPRCCTRGSSRARRRARTSGSRARISRSATSACCGTPCPISPRHGTPRIPGPVWTRPKAGPWRGCFRLVSGTGSSMPGSRPRSGCSRGSLPPGWRRPRRWPTGRGAAAGSRWCWAPGNVSSIGPLDALYKLFVENHVVLYKAHPVNDYLGPLMERASGASWNAVVLRLVYGGAAEGAYLCQHAGVDEIHITGSDKTYEAIVFGPGADGERRKAERPAAPDQADHGRAGQRQPGDRRPRAVECRRPPLSRGEPRLDADQQRRVQLQRDPRDRPARRRGRSARPCSTPCAPCWRGCRRGAPTIRAPRAATPPSAPRIPRRSGSGRTRTAACPGP